MQKNTERSLLTALNNDRDKNNDRYTERQKKQSRGDESVRDESFTNYK